MSESRLLTPANACKRTFRRFIETGKALGLAKPVPMRNIGRVQPQIDAVRDYLRELQAGLCLGLESEETAARFKRDSWSRAVGGGGVSAVMENGAVLEKAGVNFSHVRGNQLPAAATARRPELTGREFQAMGVSAVIHPRNPYVPTAHCNVRFFVAEAAELDPVWWFGGGYDLTPYYPFEEDCVHWHRAARTACAPWGDDVYPRFKRWADDYFYLKHRDEPRGVGGLFFDDLSEWGFDRCFGFTRSVGESFLEAYLPIVRKRKDTPFGERQRGFQLYRRGRYVEFNLLQDRGTVFGLQTGGRAESILMSLPPLVSWKYDWQPEPGSAEAQLCAQFLKRREWL